VAAAYEAAGVEFRTQQKIAQQEWHKEQIRLLNSPEV
jgi:hypothetical protein